MNLIHKKEKYMINNITKKIIFEKLPTYKKNQNKILNFGFFLTFSLILIVVFSYLSYSFLFYTFLLASAIFAIITFYFYKEFYSIQQKYNMLYPDCQDMIQNIVIIDHGDQNISESMIIWFFVNKEKIDSYIYIPLLLNSMKYDINHTDSYNNTLLHYILKDDDNHHKLCISHALLIGADVDIKNDKLITPRFLLSQKYPEYLAIMEQIEISKSFER